MLSSSKINSEAVTQVTSCVSSWMGFFFGEGEQLAEVYSLVLSLRNSLEESLTRWIQQPN